MVREMTSTLRIFAFFAAFVLALGCGKEDIDYSDWYDDDDKESTETPGTGDDSGEAVEGDLRVMSFNVRYPASTDTGEKSWSNRKKGVYAMIEAKKPMLIGVQECYISQRNDIMNNIKGYACYGVGRDDGKDKGETTSIIYDKSLFSLKEYGTFWLTEKDITQPNTGWDATIKRTTTWAKLEMKSNKQQFFFVNTHLDHQGATAKAEGLKLIKQKLDEMNPAGLPVVLTGDFNEEPTSAIFNVLLMKNARNTAPKTDYSATSNGWGSKSQTIDHIFFNNFEVLQYQTIKDRWDGVTYISDHYPIMATFNFNK